MRGHGETVMFISIDGKIAGLLGVADPDKGNGARGDQPAPYRRHTHRHGYGRQPDDGGGGLKKARS